MNIEVTSIYPNTWRIVKSRTFSVLAAGGIAVAAFVAGSSLNGNEPRAISIPPAAASIEAPSRIAEMTARPTMTYFLVDSEEQHALVVAEQQQVAADRKASGGRQHFFEVTVANTLATETEAWDLLRDLQTSWALREATNLNVIDLRAQ